MTDELIFQIEDAEKMGLHGEALYVIEYDLNSRRIIPKNVSETEREEMERYNKVANEIRNKLFFALKFRIMATKHLESSWLISKERLGQAVAEIDAIKAEMKLGGFDNVDKRIRIIPIMTTEDGFENYEDQRFNSFCNSAQNISNTAIKP